MSSWFDSEVYSRRKHTEWATISLLSFINEMLWNGSDNPHENEVILRARYRPDVSTRHWFEIEWTGEDEKRHMASSQEFGLMMWRAAQTEINAREKLKRKSGNWRVDFQGEVSDKSVCYDDLTDANMEAVRMSGETKRPIEVRQDGAGKAEMIVIDGWTFR